MKATQLLCVLAVATFCSAQASTTVLYDGHGSYIKPAASDVQLEAHDLPAMLSALLGQEATEGQTSQKVEAVLTSDLLARPDAIIALHVLGAGEGITQMTLPSARHVPLRIKMGTMELLKHVASTVQRGLGRIAYQALDHTALPESCGESCRSQLVQGDHRALDLAQEPDRLWARELGVLRHIALAAASTRATRGRPLDRPQLLEGTLVGLQALGLKYGSDSKQVAAAQAMLNGTLKEIWAALHAAHDGKVILQLSVPEPLLPGSTLKVDDVLQWQSTHQAGLRRRLLQQDAAMPEARHTAAFLWASSSIAWLMSIILIAGVIAASVCLCNMSSEQDTLLYASNKAD